MDLCVTNCKKKDKENQKPQEMTVAHLEKKKKHPENHKCVTRCCKI